MEGGMEMSVPVYKWMNGIFDFVMELFSQLIPFLIAIAIVTSILLIRYLIANINQRKKVPRSIFLTGSTTKKKLRKQDYRFRFLSDSIGRRRQKRQLPRVIKVTDSKRRRKQKEQEPSLITLSLADDTEEIEANMSQCDLDENTNDLLLIQNLKKLAMENVNTGVEITDVKSHLRNEIQRAKEVVSNHEKIKLIREKEAKLKFEPITEALKHMQNELESQNGDIKFHLSDQDAIIEMGNNSGLILCKYGDSGYFQLMEKQEFELPEPYFHESEMELYGSDTVIDYISKAIACYIALKASKSV